MKLRFYLLIALAAFLVAVTGSDLVARITIAREGFSDAVMGHLEWVSLTVFGMVLLFIPFGLVALICAFVEQRIGRALALPIFAVGLAALTYLYFNGFQDAQFAAAEQRWTSATLSVGLLPLYAGIPAVMFTVVAACVAAMICKRPAASG